MFIVNTAGAGEGIRIWVLMFCVEFWELPHLTRDLSQAEKKTNIVTSLANAQRQNEDNSLVVHNKKYFFSA